MVSYDTQKAMNLKKYIVLAFAMIIFGCANDDGSSDQEQLQDTASFIVIGEDIENIYQYSFEGSTETGTLVNLTQDSGVPLNYLTLREVGDIISFYSFSNGSFSLVQVDVVTGAEANYPNLLPVTADRSIAWGTNTLSNAFFGYFGPAGMRNFSIVDVGLQVEDIQDRMIDFNVDTALQPLLFGDKIYIVYRDNLGNYKLTFYAIETKTRGPILDFQNIPISLIIEDSGNLAVIKNGTAPTLELFDGNLGFIKSSPLNFNSGFPSGPVYGAVLKNDKLYYALRYVQPSRYPFGPAVFDFATQNNDIIDLFGIAGAVEAELGTTIEITTQTFDAGQDMFFVGYAIPTENEPSGGVLQISAAGELIANVSLSFFPSYFMSGI